MSDRKSLTLYELNTFIKRIIALNFEEPVWVVAEVLQINEKRGHTYLTLIQKDDQSEEIAAQSNAVVWAGDMNLLRKKSPDIGSYLIAGHQLMLQVAPVYHERFGFQLVVKDIDTAFTKGAMDLAKEALFERIRQEGLEVHNKQKPLPTCYTRLAVITSDQAAGYKDFKKHLQVNSGGLRFNIALFNSSMQGQNLKGDMMRALDSITERYQEFDAVVIIRGGGSRADLAGFDNYELAYKIAHSPLPVLIGIGHEIDVSVLDIVAALSFKTPTAVAEYLLNYNLGFLAEITNLYASICQHVTFTLDKKRAGLDKLFREVQFSAISQLRKRQNNLLSQFMSVKSTLLFNLLKKRNHVQQVYDTLVLKNPLEILKKGYVIVSQNNQKITSVKDLNPAAETKLVFHDGTGIINN